MRRAPLVACVVVLLVAAIPVLAYLTTPREVISSTPSDYTGLTVPLGVPAHGRACADQILFDTDSQVARFGAIAAPGVAGPPLEVVAGGDRAGEFRSGYRSVARIPGGWRGTREFDVRLRPPAKAVFGTFCVRNLSAQVVQLVGSQDGRAYSRPTVSVNGQVTGEELQLRLLEARKRSVLDRLGLVTGHAATLKPLGAWVFWVLSFVLLAVIPLLLLSAIRAAVSADPVRDGPGPLAAAWTRQRRRQVAAIPAWALLAAGATLAVLWLFYWSIGTKVFSNDEDQYVYLSRWLLHDFPRGLFELQMYNRGLQRLEVWLLALPAALFHEPWSLAFGRLLNTVAFVSTAVPVYLLGRRLDLGRHWAVLVALLSAVVPWAVVTTSLLTENVAYPAFAWALYATWRTTVDPSPGRDVLALLAVLVAGLARSALLALAPMLPLVVLITGLRCGDGSLKARLRGVWREHVVLWVAVGAAALVLLAGPLGVGPQGGILARLAGAYGTPWAVDVSLLLSKAGRFLSRVVVGTGFLPAVVGLPWLAVVLARSRDRTRFAFALSAVLSAVIVLYTLESAGYDERYIVYLAPPLLLAAGAAVARREVTALGVAVTSVLLALLLVRVPWSTDLGPYTYFAFPAETFYAHIAAFKLDRVLPGGFQDAAAALGVLLGVAGVALAAVMRRAPRRLSGGTGAAVVALVVVAILAQTQYSLARYVNGAGSRAGAGLSTRAFADRTVPGNASLGLFEAGPGAAPEFAPLWREVQFYNQRIDSIFVIGPLTSPVLPGQALNDGVTYDASTGALHTQLRLPDYAIASSDILGPHLRGQVVKSLSYLPVQLIRVARPAAIAWSGDGFGLDGSVAAPSGGKLRVYAGGGTRCVRVGLITVTPTSPADWQIRVAGGPAQQGQLAPAQQRVVTVPLTDLATQPYADLRVRGHARVFTVEPTADCHNGGA